MYVDSLIAELRAAIARKGACTAELGELGIDPEEAESERNLRASRALFHPAKVCYGHEDGKTKRSWLRQVSIEKWIVIGLTVAGRFGCSLFSARSEHGSVRATAVACAPRRLTTRL